MDEEVMHENESEEIMDEYDEMLYEDGNEETTDENRETTDEDEETTDEDEETTDYEEMTNEDESDEEVDKDKGKEKDKNKEMSYDLKVENYYNWHIVPEVINRQIGSNSLFQRRFYGSLYAVEHLKSLYDLHDSIMHDIMDLDFNQKGNLLACAPSNNTKVFIWDWARGKNHYWSFKSGHEFLVRQVKWLPLNEDSLLVTCGSGQVRLLDLERNMSKKLAVHRGSSHTLAVHLETPHVVLSAGEDARIFSIDVRSCKPNTLHVVKQGSLKIELASIHCNPFNSNEFCVSGLNTSYVSVYDQRKILTSLYKLCPNHLKNEDGMCTRAIYNHNGTEILATYNEDIYLFDDLLMSPCGNYAHRYYGRINDSTGQGVNFFGPKSEYIISGSDCGSIFIWDKNMEVVVRRIKGDEDKMTMCLERHPHLPVLAIGETDCNVKIWVPS